LPEKDSTAYFFLFHSIHDVLKAENVLKGQGTLFELVPVPRTLSSDCGVCITSEAHPDDIASLLSSLHVHKCFFFNGKEFLQIVLHDPASVHCKELDPRVKE
jgi:hypothetical protein